MSQTASPELMLHAISVGSIASRLSWGSLVCLESECRSARRSRTVSSANSESSRSHRCIQPPVGRIGRASHLIARSGSVAKSRQTHVDGSGKMERVCRVRWCRVLCIAACHGLVGMQNGSGCMNKLGSHRRSMTRRGGPRFVPRGTKSPAGAHTKCSTGAHPKCSAGAHPKCSTGAHTKCPTGAHPEPLQAGDQR